MAQATAGQRIASRNPLEIVIDRTWRFFCSVRVAMAEIALLAVLVLIGTLRGSSVPDSIAVLLPFTRPVVDAWYAWDVFHSLPFMGLLTVISVAIAICTINRVPGIWASIAHPTIATTHGFLRNAERSGEITSPLSPAALATQSRAAIAKSGYRALADERQREIHLYADRFRYARLGTFPFHLALILILVGGIVSARWGFREMEFMLAEGSQRAVGYGTDLSVRLNDFSETYTEQGIAADYHSDFTLLRDGEPLESAIISPNHPFTHGDMTFYQSGFGQAVVMQITDVAGNVRFEDALPLGQFRSADNPEAPAAVIDVPTAGVSMTVIAPDENPRSQPELDQLNLRSGQMYLLLRPLGPSSPIAEPLAITLNQGTPVPAGDLSITFLRETRFSALQIARNPGISIFYAASFLLVAGLAVTFYFPHRRIRGIVSPTPGGGSKLVLAPMARRDWSGQQAFDRLLNNLETSLGAPIARIDRVTEPPAGAAGRQHVATSP
ncbi:MAG: cytochrome c biogenesis protein ResB [Chloroflexia bacterium]|nr:cytochrome c biogenesis protein ResB [Chloroflexia bacterium]